MELLRVMFHYFIRNYNATQCYLEMNEIVNARLNPQRTANEDIYQISSNTIRHVFVHARKQIHYWTQNNYRRAKLGRFGRQIEIDESVFMHANVEGHRVGVWVLGFWERGTKDMRAIVVKDRSEATLT